jgi:hypothetical protein
MQKLHVKHIVPGFLYRRLIGNHIGDVLITEVNGALCNAYDFGRDEYIQVVRASIVAGIRKGIFLSLNPEEYR